MRRKEEGAMQIIKLKIIAFQLYVDFFFYGLQVTFWTFWCEYIRMNLYNSGLQSTLLYNHLNILMTQAIFSLKILINKHLLVLIILFHFTRVEDLNPVLKISAKSGSGLLSSASAREPKSELFIYCLLYI